ncbi:hypothetical protein FF38_00475 [Lucilia cuprina]|uniref:Uncharacterized protein n=1 Tax=Lucilia cuprina TaxID=7375 RepID=A0A0L0CJ99_LUCCU|nr:hypothetical protein FF38_00475 [Lucilia cuprina]
MSTYLKYHISLPLFSGIGVRERVAAPPTAAVDCLFGFVGGGVNLFVVAAIAVNSFLLLLLFSLVPKIPSLTSSSNLTQFSFLFTFLEPSAKSDVEAFRSTSFTPSLFLNKHICIQNPIVSLLSSSLLANWQHDFLIFRKVPTSRRKCYDFGS